jgi:hypothetical protein
MKIFNFFAFITTKTPYKNATKRGIDGLGHIV